MTYRSLRDFVAKLESERELVRVREPVSSAFELTEIQTRLIAEQGPAALFEHVIAHPDEFLDVSRGEPVERLAIDFIAGMTDRYAINLYERLFVPRAWV